MAPLPPPKLPERGSTMRPTITTFGWVPEFARGFVRDIRPRWAFEEVGQPYDVEYATDSKSPDFRRHQPFGQVPFYHDEQVELFESGAIVLRIAERAGKLIPADPAARSRAVQWVIAALNTVEPFAMAVVINNLFEADQPWSAMRRPKVVADLRSRLVDLDRAIGDKPWLDGDEFTVGDLMMVAVLAGLRGTRALDGLPRLADYVARGEDRPARAKAMADHLATFKGAGPTPPTTPQRQGELA
jgi:glutathione S-transferase